MSEPIPEPIVVKCPICGAVMNLLPLRRAVSCSKCVTILPLDKVTWLNDSLDKAGAYDEMNQRVEEAMKDGG